MYFLPTRSPAVAADGLPQNEAILTHLFLFLALTTEYTKDHELIPRSTSVIARRLPPARPGRGNATKYMAGAEESGQGLQAGRGAAPEPRGGVGSGFSKDMYTKRFDGREDPQPSGSNQVRFWHYELTSGTDSYRSRLAPAPFVRSLHRIPCTQKSVQISASAPNDEASAMAAMFAATNTQWQQTQEQMAKSVVFPSFGRIPRSRADREFTQRDSDLPQSECCEPATSAG